MHEQQNGVAANEELLVAAGDVGEIAQFLWVKHSLQSNLELGVLQFIIIPILDRSGGTPQGIVLYVLIIWWMNQSPSHTHILSVWLPLDAVPERRQV